jgi:hypothetical protein
MFLLLIIRQELFGSAKISLSSLRGVNRILMFLTVQKK